MADGVDRPRRVMKQRDANQAAPEERGQRTLPGAAPGEPDQRRHEEADGGEGAEGVADPHDVAVGEQVGSEALLVGLLDVEEPADVRVPETLGQGLGVAAVAPWRMRVALLVAEGVVTAVVGDPADHWALDREAAGDRERNAHGAGRLAGAGGEVAVEPDRG